MGARYAIEVEAPFFKGGRWVWVKFWSAGNVHAGVIAKGKELEATAWDTSQVYPRFPELVKVGTETKVYGERK